jgi:hypothetical protein
MFRRTRGLKPEGVTGVFLGGKSRGRQLHIGKFHHVYVSEFTTGYRRAISAVNWPL